MGVTFIMAVYGQPLMLEKWWETLRSYPDETLDRIAIVIIDDHGDPSVNIPGDIRADCDISLYRVDEDIAWNQMGARNLGMQQAKTGWCVMLDPDMVVEPEQAALMIASAKIMKRGELVKVNLRYTNDVLDSSSPNVYLIHKQDFEAVGGYDEDYAGHKGWSDVQLMHTLRGSGIRFKKDHGLWVRYYQRKDIEDATVNTLNRNTKHNRAIHLRKMAIAKRSWAKWNRREQKRIRFPWTRVV